LKAQVVDLSERISTLSEKESGTDPLPTREQLMEDLDWVIQFGIVKVVKTILHSDVFADTTTSVQRACMEYGRDKACTEMREKYADLIGHTLSLHTLSLYVFHDVAPRAMACFSALVEHDHPLLYSLHIGKMFVEAMKRMPDPSVGSGLSG